MILSLAVAASVDSSHSCRQQWYCTTAGDLTLMLMAKYNGQRRTSRRRAITQLKSVRVTRLKRRSFPWRPLPLCRASHHVRSHRKTVRQALNDRCRHQQSLDVTAAHDRKYFPTSGPCCWSRAAPFCYFRSIRRAHSVTVRDGRGKGPLYVRSDRTGRTRGLFVDCCWSSRINRCRINSNCGVDADCTQPIEARPNNVFRFTRLRGL